MHQRDDDEADEDHRSFSSRAQRVARVAGRTTRLNVSGELKKESYSLFLSTCFLSLLHVILFCANDDTRKVNM